MRIMFNEIPRQFYCRKLLHISKDFVDISKNIRAYQETIPDIFVNKSTNFIDNSNIVLKHSMHLLENGRAFPQISEMLCRAS